MHIVINALDLYGNDVILGEADYIWELKGLEGYKGKGEDWKNGSYGVWYNTTTVTTPNMARPTHLFSFQDYKGLPSFPFNIRTDENRAASALARLP